MRIAELSRATGVPVPTIKYYVREGLLPPGELTSRNQAQYGESHVRRLKLVRALVEVGGASVAAAREAVGFLDAEDKSLHKKIGAAHHLLNRSSPLPVEARDRDRAEAEVRDLLAELGWAVQPRNPAAEVLAQALAALHWLGQEAFAGQLRAYAEAAQAAARADFAAMRGDPGADAEAVVESAVVGTVLGDVLLAALRHLAQEQLSAALYGGAAADESP